MATFFCPQGGHCREVQLQSLSLVERVKSWSLRLCNLTFPWFSCFLYQATIAAFAASEGHAHPRVVELPKVSIWVVSWCFDGAMTKIMVYCNRKDWKKKNVPHHNAVGNQWLLSCPKHLKTSLILKFRTVKRRYKEALLLPSSHISYYLRRARAAQWLEHSPPLSVALV